MWKYLILFVMPLGTMLPVPGPQHARAQGAGDSAEGAAGGDAQWVELDFPENVELRVLVEYVSRRLEINILYDEQMADKRLTIQAPQRVPVRSLEVLLASALKMKGLVLVDGEQAGWKRIVQAQELTRIAEAPADGVKGADQPMRAVTRMFPLAHTQPQQVDQVIKPFLSQPGGNSLAVAEHGLLIVTDYARNIERIAALVERVDRPGPPIVIRFVEVEHRRADQLAQQMTELLKARVGAEPGGRKGSSSAAVLSDPRTNQLVLIGSAAAIEAARELSASLDVELGLETRLYPFQSVTPERVDRLVRELIGEADAERLYRSAIDREGNLLIVTAPPSIQEQVASIRERLDRPEAAGRSPIRFYELENASALEVLETIRSIEGEYGLGGVSMGGSAERGTDGGAESEPESEPESGGWGGGGESAGGDRAAQDAVRPTASVGDRAPRPPSYRADSGAGGDLLASPEAGPGLSQAGRGRELRRGHAVQTPDARVMADPHTNTIIVIADPPAQELYERLIERLDQRRPQVLVEATLVAIDTSNRFSLGVELSRTTELEEGGEERVLSFSSFGLSEVDPETGRLTLQPGLGFNGVVLSSDIANIVLRALRTEQRAKVISAPRLLISDNATGVLDSVNERPFTSVNASDTVATTSFAGFAEAGTTITLRPQISEGEHVNLSYELELSSFSGEGGGEDIPPPRQRNSVSSEVTIPDGSTIIVGGLNRQDRSEGIERVPILGELPLLEYLFSNRSRDRSESTLFVFLRPVILRDDRFRNLKFISSGELRDAGLEGNHPRSAPLLIR